MIKAQGVVSTIHLRCPPWINVNTFSEIEATRNQSSRDKQTAVIFSTAWTTWL